MGRPQAYRRYQRVAEWDNTELHGNVSVGPSSRTVDQPDQLRAAAGLPGYAMVHRLHDRELLRRQHRLAKPQLVRLAAQPRPRLVTLAVCQLGRGTYRQK